MAASAPMPPTNSQPGARRRSRLPTRAVTTTTDRPVAIGTQIDGS